MDKPELLLCPFCGGNAELVIGLPGCRFVQCRECRANTDDGTTEHAIERWNRRTTERTNG